MSWHIRFRESDPYGRAGSVSTSSWADRADAEEIARAMANAEHVEVVEQLAEPPP